MDEVDWFVEDGVEPRFKSSLQRPEAREGQQVYNQANDELGTSTCPQKAALHTSPHLHPDLKSLSNAYRELVSNTRLEEPRYSRVRRHLCIIVIQ
jgi:hypothetical protein